MDVDFGENGEKRRIKMIMSIKKIKEGENKDRLVWINKMSGFIS